MKRFILAAFIITLIIGSGVWSLLKFNEFNIKTAVFLDNMSNTSLQNYPYSVLSDSIQFRQLWLDYQDIFVAFFNREPLEQIGFYAVRLPALAEFGESAEFYSTIQELKFAIYELWESELPIPKNLF